MTGGATIHDILRNASHGGQLPRAPSSLDAQTLQTLAGVGTLRGIEAEQRLFDDGDPSDVCGLVLAGLLRHQRGGADGQRQILNLILPGEVIDGHGLLRRGHALEAATPAQFLAVPRRLFDWLLRDLPKLQLAAARSRHAQRDRVRRLAWAILAPDPRARVCALLDLASLWAPCEPLRLGGHVLTLRLAVSDIGDILALSPAAVDRAFHGLELEGLILREAAGRISIPRPLALRSEAATPDMTT